MAQLTHRHVVPVAPAELPDSARVWDYDELSDRAQHALTRAVDGEEGIEIDGVESGDVVVYTDYYLIR